MERTAGVAQSPPSLGHLGKYRLEQKLGEGGFGTVYKAYDPDLEVYRAIKIPAIQDDDAQAILKEARLQARLTHPNLVQVHSVEQFDGRWAIVMEYLEGGSLRDRINLSGALSLEDALRYTAGIASGMSAAHAGNILHHDIKPENVLFDGSGSPKVTDFGIARVFRETKRDMSRVMGTVAYMSPEQLEGTADLRSDIWSLGIMLYEMLSGKLCFDGKSQAEIVKNIVMSRPVPLRTANRLVPGEIEHIVMRMLEKDPHARYQTMDEIVRDISSYRKGEAGVRKRPARAIIAVLAAVLFILFGVVYAVHTGLFSGTETKPAKIAAPAVPLVEIPKDVKALKFDEQIERADSYINERNYALAYHILANVIDSTEDKGIKARARLSRGLLLSEDMNLPDLALKDYLAVLGENPDSASAAKAHYYAGWIYYEKKKDPRAAIPHLEEVVNRYPESPMAQTAQFLLQEAREKVEN